VAARPAADLVDASGQPVGVSGRGMVTAAPARLSVASHPSGRTSVWHEVVAWAGPWPVDERWWDPTDHRRLARFQVVTEDGTARLLILDGGRWFGDAVYD
jgi:protein ImuB